ncbi:MAG: HEAT repeat domain-containing protein [Nodosilinea sp.]
MDNGDRTQLFNALSNLSPQDFEKLLFTLKPPAGLLPGGEAAQMNRVKALLDWAEGSTGRGLDEVRDGLNGVKNNTLSAAFDFSDYLKAIYKDPRYQDARDLYTETEALISLEAETVERKLSGEGEHDAAPSSQSKVERLPVLEGLRKYALGDERKHVLLAGRPGSGKSTTLKRLLLEIADAGSGQAEKIPVFVQLKGDRTITDLILAEFRRAKVRVTAEQLEDWLFNDQLLLLLDGVNEIPSEDHRRKLQEFREDNPTTPMIFTTRDLAVGGDLGIEQRLEMRPLNEPQMREFVQKYLPDHADTLLRQLKDRLREIAETPLLLKMLCDVFDPTTQQIPQSKGELFRLFDAQYNRFKRLAAVSDDFRRFKPELLRHLAFRMMQGDSAKPMKPWLKIERTRAEKILEDWLTGRIEAPGQRAKEWLEDLLEHHLLQVAVDSREIEFHHQLFQEYYAAEELLVMLQDGHPDMADNQRLKYFYLNYLKWTEPIALMLALVDDEAQALRVVKLAMDDVDLMLGARLSGEVQSEFQSNTVNFVIDLDAIALFKIKLLGITESNYSLSILSRYLSNQNSDIKIAAINAIGDIGSQDSENVLIELMREEDFEVCDKAAYQLGRIGSPNATNTLLKTLNQQNSCFRKGIARALGEINSEASINALCNILETDDNQEILLYAGLSLAKLRSQTTLPLSCQNLVDKVLPQRLDPQNTDHMIEMGSEQKQSTEQESKDSMLGELMNGTSIGFRLTDLAYQLLKLYGDEMLPIFQQALYSTSYNFSTRFAIARALAEMKYSDSIPTLLQGLKNRNMFFYSNANISLERIGNPELISKIYEFLRYRKNIKPLHFRHLVDTVSAVQSRCQFYNYEIAQLKPAPATPQPAASSHSSTTINAEVVTIVERNEGGTVIGKSISTPDSNP